jgi:hypothetical protein
LDVTFLKKMGLSKQRMEQCDALLFYQLLLPIVDPAMSVIDGDTRMGYYENVARNTNMYAFGVKNRGGIRGHIFHPTNAEESWLGIPIFGSDFWDPHRKRNYNSVFDSKDSGWIFF